MQTLTLTLYIFLFFLFNASAAHADAYKISDLRKQYLEASLDSDAGKDFHKLMSNYNDTDPVVLAYKAASEATMAKYVWNPYNKLKHIKTATSLFDEAVTMNSSNPEIRFLRFTVEHYVPRYLNLSANLEQDKKIIINSLKNHPNSGLSPDWAQTMHQFMLSKDHCTEAEKKELRKIKL